MSAAPTPPLFNSILFNQALFGSGSASGHSVEVGAGLLYPALRKAGVTLGPGRTPSPAQFQDAIDELNRLVGSLNCDRLFIYALDKLELSVDGSKRDWTIGQDPTGNSTPDFDYPRPDAIAWASLSDGVGGDIPLQVLTPQQAAGAVSSCGCGCGQDGIYYDRAYPVATIHLAAPPPGGMSLNLWVWHKIPRFQNVTDAAVLPDGYEDALVLNLAVRLAPHFQRVLDQNIREDARLSLMRVLSINAPRPILELESWLYGCGCDGGGGSFTVLSGGSSSSSGTAGPPGPPGPPGPAANLVWAEAPTGAVDGVNNTFFLAHTPVSGVKLFVNGVGQRPSLDYTLSGSQITFSVSPKMGETIVANYNY